MSEEKIKSLDDYLQHYGVKGMRWGVRNDSPTLREKFNSLKREHQWKKVVRNVDKLTTEEINIVTKRLGMENDLKRLSKSTGRSKHDYIRREKLSDDDLRDKVVRLRAHDALLKSAKTATQEQREFGKKVVDVGGTLAIKYAANKKITAKDIVDSINKPKDIQKEVKDKSLEDLLKNQ